MHAQEFVLYYGRDGKIIENFHKGSIGGYLRIFLITFIIETVVFSRDPAFMISPQKYDI